MGINGLFNNILSVLGLAELGIGSAIVYNLYDPIAKEQKEQIKSLMYFYKKSYQVIALMIGAIGCIIMFFLPQIVGETSVKENIYYIFFLFLIDILISYIATYKRSILYAYQKNYIINIVHIIYLIVLNGLQILSLLITKNFIYYLILKIICRILESLIINISINKRYPYLKERNVKPLEDKVKNGIIEKVKGLVFHKIGAVAISGTDNIIISKFIGVGTVGLYSNYNLIIRSVSNLFSQAFTAITASVGNLLIEKNSEKNYQVFKNLLFLNNWIYTFGAVAIACLIEPFITIWIGSQYILSKIVLIMLIINFYLQGLKDTFNIFKEAAGIFYEDRYIPVIESIINIVSSIILVKLYGLAGVFFGTILSQLVLFLYSYPKYIYRVLLRKDYKRYVKKLLECITMFILCITFTAFICFTIQIENSFIKLILNGVVCILIPNIVFIIVYRKSKELKYYIGILMKMKKVNN